MRGPHAGTGVAVPKSGSYTVRGAELGADSSREVAWGPRGASATERTLSASRGTAAGRPPAWPVHVSRAPESEGSSPVNTWHLLSPARFSSFR